MTTLHVDGTPAGRLPRPAAAMPGDQMAATLARHGTLPVFPTAPGPVEHVGGEVTPSPRSSDAGIGVAGSAREVLEADRVGSGSYLARAMAINEIAEDLAGEFMLRPLLERILQRCAELMGCEAGSISSVDEAKGTYCKQADIGVRCRSGQEFPLSEGMTGEVVRRRGPVWFDRYDQVVGGHISMDERRTLKGVIGVPLEWRGRVIGACVIFTKDPQRRFGEDDAALLNMFARHAAVALANAETYAAAEEHARRTAAMAERDRVMREIEDQLAQGAAGLRALLRDAETVADDPEKVRTSLQSAQRAADATASSIRRTLLGLSVSALEGRSLEDALRGELEWAGQLRAIDARLVVAGARMPVDREVAHEALRIAQEAIANVVQHANAGTLRVGLVYSAGALTLLIQDDGQGFAPHDDVAGYGLRRISERALRLGGSVAIDPVPGWGTSVRASLPLMRPKGRPRSAVGVVVIDPSPAVRAGISRLLSWSEPSIHLVAEVADVDDVCLPGLFGDVVIVGPNVHRSRCEVIRTVGAFVSAPVLVMGRGFQDEVQDAMDAGAVAWIDPDVDGGQLAESVLRAARGQTVIPHGAHVADRPVEQPGEQRLTSREREVRVLVEKGLTDKTIAGRLMISVKTVEKHVSAILRKAGYRSRLELVADVRQGASTHARSGVRDDR